ncbi:hypothetical protein [Salarchaeum japonicum]|uniref:hypothetical protein n=1 Tax=Salarchaeum japonicum TaxID=555573 RepID=UPI003C782B19
MAETTYVHRDDFGERLVDRLHDRVGETLRSVVAYTTDEYALWYLREDVEHRYTPEDVAAAVEEMRLETLHRDYINDVFAERCGDLRCSITYFTESVEMNFPISEGEGLAISVDEHHFTEQTDLVKNVTTFLDEEASSEFFEP